jgi:hypothetical protein
MPSLIRPTKGDKMNGITANTILMITILVVLPALFLGAAYLFRRAESKERLLAIEKGVYKPPTFEDIRRRTRRAAIVLIAGGLGVILAFAIQALLKRDIAEMASAGLAIVPLAIGLGLLIDLGFQRRDLTRRSRSDQK